MTFTEQEKRALEIAISKAGGTLTFDVAEKGTVLKENGKKITRERFEQLAKADGKTGLSADDINKVSSKPTVATGSVAFVGDSWMVGIAGKSTTVEGGKNLQWIKDRAFSIIDSSNRPQVLVVNGGLNNGLQNASPASIVKYFKEIVEKARANGVKVVIVGIDERCVYDNGFKVGEKAKAINLELAKLAGSDVAFVNPTDLKDKGFKVSGFHAASQADYKILADAIKGKVELLNGSVSVVSSENKTDVQPTMTEYIFDILSNKRSAFINFNNSDANIEASVPATALKFLKKLFCDNENATTDELRKAVIKTQQGRVTKPDGTAVDLRDDQVLGIRTLISKLQEKGFSFTSAFSFGGIEFSLFNTAFFKDLESSGFNWEQGDGEGFEDMNVTNSADTISKVSRGYVRDDDVYIEATAADIMSYVNERWQKLGLKGPIDLLGATRIRQALKGIRLFESEGSNGTASGYGIGNYSGSSAKGAYQFMSSTVRDLRRWGVIDGTFPHNDGRASRLEQDFAAIFLIGSPLKNREVLDEIVAGNIEGAMYQLSAEWRGIASDSRGLTFQDQYASSNKAGKNSYWRMLALVKKATA